jgi:PTS system nitrogen regulatory IIA component
MFNLDKVLDIENVCAHMQAGSRKRALQLIAEMVADDQIDADSLFDELMARERLGSTGLGEGVAIPHCRIDCEQMRACFVSLPTPIDYEASDGESVDLLFTLIVPINEQHAHLEALAALSGVFSNHENRRVLRACTTAATLKQSLNSQLAENEPNAKTA